MNKTVLILRGKQITAVRQSHWEKHLEAIPEHGKERLAFMLTAHHRVRDCAVRELIWRGEPLAPRYISATLGMDVAGTTALLEQLERRLFFLVRDDDGAVTWAYPVTVQQTPHHLTFDSGHQVYAA